MSNHYDILALIVAIGGGLLGLLRIVLKRLHGINRFLDEWNGTENRPGVMKRLETLESQQQCIVREITLNGGKSLKDSVHRTERRLERIENKLGCPS